MSTIPPHGRILALDWGTNRIGLALSDETQLLASPLLVLTRRAGRRFPMAGFLAAVEAHRPVGLVVGLPLDDDGREGPSAIAAREMGMTCAARTALPIDWTDESFTTAIASANLRKAGGRVHADRIDAVAAAQLLQEWLQLRPRTPR